MSVSKWQEEYNLLMTMTYSDAELESFLSDLEADWIERKESFKGDAPTKGREAVCAFANDLPGRGKAGVLFVGVRDDGEPSRCPITDELLLSLANMKTDGNILPLPTMVVEKRHLKGADGAAPLNCHPSGGAHPERTPPSQQFAV